MSSMKLPNWILCLALSLSCVLRANGAAGEIDIRVAVELELMTQPGVSYALQSSTNLSTWTTEEIIPGSNQSTIRFRSTVGTVARQFRLVAVPVISGSLSNQSVNAGATLNYTFPGDVFTDSTGGGLTYQAALAGGGNLPAWLNFDALARTFSGAPAEIDAGSFIVEVSARNAAGVAASLTFTITVAGSAPNGFVLIPAGTFMMGDSFTEGFSDERPVHSVFVSAFFMKITEVTKAEWDDVASWAATHGYDISEGSGYSEGTNHPVSEVSWLECVKYANARSEREALTPVYTVSGGVFKTGTNTPTINFTANGYRLPTEAEWEKAARGGLSGKRFSWGDTITHTNATYYSDPFYAYDVSSTRDLHPVYGFSSSPVAAFAPNGYGLYDMTGNVWEWCSDWAAADYYANSPASDPHGPDTGTGRSYRGGAWFVNANLNRVAYRDQADAAGNDGTSGFGFRLARNVGN